MSKQPDSHHNDSIAIIGMSCIFPGASNLHHYWNNIIDGVDAISDVPTQRWNPQYYNPTSDAVDRFYCRRGGFVDEFVDFDPLAFGIMPKAAEGADPDQLLALRVGSEALTDAGLLQKSFNRERCGVVIGRGNYLSAGTLRLEQHVRMVQQTLSLVDDLLPSLESHQRDLLESQLRDQLDHYGPDTAVGLIPNLVASRLANRLDLKGPAYTVDAACASALIALEQACNELRSARCDVMLAGGLHFCHDLTFWATFCQLGALSREQHIRPFDQRADGIIAGEGIGMLVLKRSADALRDGDRIYALVDGIASSSDGRSSSLLAPSVSGQLLALERAWQQTSLDSQYIGLMEAHGTGTPSGDLAELETLKNFFGSIKKNETRAVIGSVKSMIGHTMPAAGAAGLIKAALSIYHGVLPPTLHCEQPSQALKNTRFKVIAEQANWNKSNNQRIAAVNAFGFGGINAHAVLSGADRLIGSSAVATTMMAGTAQGYAGMSQDETPITTAAPNVLMLSANSQQALLQKLELASEFEKDTYGGQWRLAIVEPNDKRRTLAKRIIEKAKPWHGRNQIYFSSQGVLQGKGKLAFVFPGVDSSFNPRAEDIAQAFDRELPPHCYANDPAKELLNVSTGVFGLNRLLHQTLVQLGVNADVVAGHSIGEWSAMLAAGVSSDKTVKKTQMLLASNKLEVPDVIFLAAGCGIEKAKKAIEGLDNIAISHDNCQHQVIVCGRLASIEIAQQRFKQQQVLAQRLAFVSGFHSPLFSDHMGIFQQAFTHGELQTSRIPLWSATTCETFPSKPDDIAELAVRHLVEPVRFREMISNMVADGVTAFIQVGTGSLVGFIDDILKGKNYLAIAANTAKRNGIEQLGHVLVSLWVEGYRAKLEQLWPSVNTPKNRLPSEKTKSSIMLRLGVPLLRVSKPLHLPSITKDSLHLHKTAMVKSNDPILSLMQSTMTDIFMAGEQVVTAWEQRQKMGNSGQTHTSYHHNHGVDVRHNDSSVDQHPLQHDQQQNATPTNAVSETHTIASIPIERTLKKRFDVQDNIPYIMDHSFHPQRPGWPVIEDLHPVIPLTMELVMMCEAVEEVVVGKTVVGIESMRAFNWFTVTKPVDFNIEVKTQSATKARVSILGYADAIAVLADDFSACPRLSTQQLENPRPTLINAQQIYSNKLMFHGPAYQGIIALEAIGDNGIKGRLRVPLGKGALLDNMGQLAGYWVMEQKRNSLAMPIGLERVDFFGKKPVVSEEFNCRVTVKYLDEQSCRSDIELYDDNDQLRVFIQGWHTRRFDMGQSFFFNSALANRHLVCDSPTSQFVLFRDEYEKAITREYLELHFLNQPERDIYQHLAPAKRRSWLDGRIAAKDAVKQFLWGREARNNVEYSETGIERCDIFSKELLVTDNEYGHPQVRAYLSNVFSEHLYISIAFKNNVSVAIASSDPVGIDIETINTRTEDVERQGLTAHERRLLPTIDRNVTVGRFLAAKVAVAKQCGADLEKNPKRFEICDVNGTQLTVANVKVNSLLLENYIICWTE